MDEFIHFLVGQIEPLMSNLPDIDFQEDSEDYEILFECKVTPDKYDRDLFVTPLKGNGRKKHHSELIADGLFTQEAFDEAVAAIEEEIRKLPEYKENGIFVFPL